ncbi:hypothetical protein LJC51_02965 [Lachnospiraceae bacterium OttesenSCG-928-J05]|nr:hypothetical protein [Lachnospiraceae bacterium OttesenSCG-928-J05]
MSKKKRISLIVSLVLIAAIGVGATLALLSTKTNILTNEFKSTAAIKAEILETDIKNPTKTTSTGNIYDLMPGDTATKNPFVRLAADSVESYVYIKVTGLDDLKGQIDTDIETVIGAGTWIKVSKEDTLDGIYRYFTTVEPGEDANGNAIPVDTKSLFTKITYSINNHGGEDFSENDIVLTGLAIQANNVKPADADTIANDANSWK